MPNRGIPPVLRIARSRLELAAADARWWLIVAVNRQIDRAVAWWLAKNKDRV